MKKIRLLCFPYAGGPAIVYNNLKNDLDGCFHKYPELAHIFLKWLTFFFLDDNVIGYFFKAEENVKKSWI